MLEELYCGRGWAAEPNLELCTRLQRLKLGEAVSVAKYKEMTKTLRQLTKLQLSM